MVDRGIGVENPLRSPSVWDFCANPSSFRRKPSAASQILDRLGLVRAEVIAELLHEVRMLRTGNTGRPVFSALVFRWFEDAWLLASAQRDDGEIHSGHLVVMWLQYPRLYGAARVRAFPQRVDVEQAERLLDELDDPPVGATRPPSRAAPRLSLVPPAEDESP